MSIPKLKKGEFIVTAWASPAAGPGWANCCLSVLVQDRAGDLRIEYVQPDDQPLVVRTLYPVSAEAHFGLVKALRGPMGEKV